MAKTFKKSAKCKLYLPVNYKNNQFGGKIAHLAALATRLNGIISGSFVT